MGILVSGIRIALEEPNEAAVAKARELLGIAAADAAETCVRRVSYDARRGRVAKVCSVVLTFPDPALEIKLAKRDKNAEVFSERPFKLKPGKETLKGRPVVVGFGPAGIFAALVLAEYGYAPLVLERGSDADGRRGKIDKFTLTGELDKNSNVQFGEGGAGAFSDGKLTTRIKDPLCRYVLETLVRHGAPKDILYEAKPHIGSDLLGGIVKNIRRGIIELGGEVRFDSAVTDIAVSAGRLISVTSGGERIFTDAAVFAAGHSAGDTVRLLVARGSEVEAKPFAVGLRIEHLQSDIDRALWGNAAGNPLLPKGEYALTSSAGGRAVYTFCMCPGGSVVAAASARGEVVVNGMSLRARDGVNANSAVVAAVDGRDFGGNPFSAMEYQRTLEKAFFDAGGKDCTAPASDVGSFLSGKAGLEVKRVAPTYPLGVAAGDIGKLLGAPVADALRMGIMEFSGKIRGFDAADAVLTGVESRTSSPVRILRNEGRQAKGIENLYPCGEGAGYAGGIMSSAVDGMKTAAVLIEKYKAPKG